MYIVQSSDSVTSVLMVDSLMKILLMPSVLYKRKKMQKVRNFFRYFRTEFLLSPAFFLAPKTGVFISRRKP